jgi:outer membrane protein OmpA-like peptidoglycan-associated protein
MDHKQASGVVVLSVAVIALSACATKGYVNKNVANVNTKVESLTRSVEETQERTKSNEGKIGLVDQKAGTAQGAADKARQAAADADAKAGLADAKAVAVDKASRKLVYTVTVSADQGNFAVGKWELPVDAKARIDELVTRVKSEEQLVYFEIEGHTDSTGPKSFNDRLGLERAEAVKKYLHDQHQIPLHKMNVISYGAEKPVAPNKTKAERAQNRRIVINVLS